VIIHKFEILQELQKLALGKPTILSPQTIALYVLSTMKWATREMEKRDEVLRLKSLFKAPDPRD